MLQQNVLPKLPLKKKQKPQTTLINIKKQFLVKKGYRDLKHWLEDPNHVYIGRHNHYVGAPSSKWKNPYSVKKYGRAGCIKKYERYIKKNKELMDSIEELRGKTLGCWCSPDACHGDVLLKIMNDKKK